MSDVNLYITPAVATRRAPIDVFYDQSREILRAGTPAFLSAHPSLGPLLLVGMVSATENYFRDLFARILQLCPVARATSVDQTIKIGSVVWHGQQNVERGAFEHISFADAEAILKSSRKFLGHDLKKTAVLDEFDKVCELRHSIVHSSSYVAGNNAIKLQIARAGVPLRVSVGFAELQESGAICASLVAAVNLELFAELARRWAVAWPKLPSWNAADRHNQFKAIWNTFHSARDAGAV